MTERIIRVKPGICPMTSAIIRFRTLLPRIATIHSVNKMLGMLIMTSMKRMMMLSTRPP